MWTDETSTLTCCDSWPLEYFHLLSASSSIKDTFLGLLGTVIVTVTGPTCGMPSAQL